MPCAAAAARSAALAIAAEAPASLPWQCAERQQRVGREAAPGRRCHALFLRDGHFGTGEIADPRACHAQLGEVERQLPERAGVAGELSLPR